MSRTRKINLSAELGGFYGQHRSGWPYVLRVLRKLHHDSGIRFDSFIERTFCWNPGGVHPHHEPWIGCLHVPPNVPRWFQYEESNDFIFQSNAWQESLPFCRGLFVFSNAHRNSLAGKLPLPICSLIHPTEKSGRIWSWRRFNANREKKIVQVGWWLRKLHTIFQLPTGKYRKIFLRITHADLDSLLKKEREILLRQGEFRDEMYQTAETVFFLPNREYDRLLAENLVIINLYDASANNTIIECIVRNTPILVNPIEPVIEYLGADYPFYFSSLAEAAAKAEDLDLVRLTHQYLHDHPLKDKLRAGYFLRTFVQSTIYQSL